MRTIIPDIEYLTRFGERWGYVRRIFMQYNFPDHTLNYYVKNLPIPSLESICNGSDEATCVVRAERKFVRNTTLGACIFAIFEDHYPEKTIETLLKDPFSLPSFTMVNQLYKSQNGADIPSSLLHSITVKIDRGGIIGHEYLIYKCHGKYYIFKKDTNKVEELSKLTIKSCILPV